MLYWSYLKINSFWLTGTVLFYMLTIILEVKCKRGLTRPNFASNEKVFLFNSITFHFILFHSISFYPISSHVSPFKPLSIHLFLSHFILLHSIPLHFILFHSIPFHFIPFPPISYLSFHFIMYQPYETDRNKSQMSLVKLKNIQIHTPCSL